MKPAARRLAMLVTHLSFLSGFSGSYAWAAPPAGHPVPPPTPTLSASLTGQARADYEAGKLLFNDGDFSGALVKFQSAYAQSHDARLLWNMAACEKNRRHYAAAIELVRRYQTEGQASLSVEDKKDADDVVATLTPLTGKLAVEVTQPDADIFVDDTKVGKSPVGHPIFLDLGEHRVRVVKPGFRDYEAKVAIAGGDTKPLEVRLEPHVAEGRVSVRAHAEDGIAIDGKTVGSGVWEGTLPAGRHHVRVSSPGKKTYDSDILVEDDKAQAFSVTLEADKTEKKGAIPTWVWIAGGVVVAGGAAVGGYFLFRPSDTVAPTPVGTLSPGSVQASFPVGR